MADWTGTLTFTPEQQQALEAFIREPDTRRDDVFAHGSLETGSPARLDWIIKHDIFEGVVVHFSLMTPDGGSFLAGVEQSLSHAPDLFQTYDIRYQGRQYSVTVKAS
ncbi:MAG: hypothetical protein C7B45_06205 [Sulfobacillus acidophilus]|uniref:Uncharacterized protein n=1 Tax=Sulfobacillus acidophilus TaxID=53633 RepID=A0A2T2WK83_9FIRM|nr:MAG: hypothetical protein C7B45_06205 [Sulfobacillus acidophilus]